MACLSQRPSINTHGGKMPTGTVKWFNDEKGYGFIELDEGGSKDAFVHITALAQGARITEGDRVTFELQDGPKGIQAVNVELGG